MLRSVLAILGGIAVLTITSFAIEAAVKPLMTAGTTPARIVQMIYTSLCIVAAGYVTAWIAARSPVRHAVIMGAIQAALTVWVMFALPFDAPLWSWIVGIAIIIPASTLGGAMRAKHTRATT